MSGNQSVVAARQAGALFAASGVLALLVVATQPAALAPLVLVGVFDVLVALVAWYLPWDRWPHRVTALLAAPALAIIGFADRYGGASPYTYTLFFVILFTWIGVSQPPLTALVLAPFAAFAYVVPLVNAGRTPIEIQSAMVAIPVFVMIGELLSRALTRVRVAEARSQKRASLLAMLSRANDDIASLDQQAVLDRLAIAVLELGYEGASVDLIDHELETFTVLHSRGLPKEYLAAVHPLSGGTLHQQVVSTGRSIVRTQPTPLFDAGYRVAVAAPIRSEGRVLAVLVGARTNALPPAQEELEAFELLAAQGAHALENARRYEEQATAAEENAQALLTDALTGIGSRRLANRMLDSLNPGDAVVLIDLDHFKRVNDSLGHAVGDRVLVELGAYLRAGLREGDGVARYGGEEFVVVIRKAKQVHEIGERLVRGWTDLQQATTFSAGIAVHVEGNPAALTLAAADQALYAAKRAGRARAELCPVTAMRADDRTENVAS